LWSSNVLVKLNMLHVYVSSDSMSLAQSAVMAQSALPSNSEDPESTPV